MATATTEPHGTQALPRELEEFIDFSIDAMDKRTLSKFEKESRKLTDAAKRCGAEPDAHRERA
jgi:hypothetical protein